MHMERQSELLSYTTLQVTSVCYVLHVNICRDHGQSFMSANQGHDPFRLGISICIVKTLVVYTTCYTKNRLVLPFLIYSFVKLKVDVSIFLLNLCRCPFLDFWLSFATGRDTKTVEALCGRLPTSGFRMLYKETASRKN